MGRDAPRCVVSICCEPRHIASSQLCRPRCSPQKKELVETCYCILYAGYPAVHCRCIDHSIVRVALLAACTCCRSRFGRDPTRRQRRTLTSRNFPGHFLGSLGRLSYCRSTLGELIFPALL